MTREFAETRQKVAAEVAAKTMGTYIDLNPVRAGMVEHPEQYRWNSYGEAIDGGAKGDGKRARTGLVRALQAHKGVAADATLWKDDVGFGISKSPTGRRGGTGGRAGGCVICIPNSGSLTSFQLVERPLVLNGQPDRIIVESGP